LLLLLVMLMTMLVLLVLLCWLSAVVVQVWMLRRECVLCATSAAPTK
jgi:hypothetical protein